MTKLERSALYEMLELPQEVVDALNAYEAQRTSELPDDLYRKLFAREQWEEDVKELQSYLGDDPTGMKILWEQLHIVCQYTYGEYVKRGFSEDIFVATMKFCTRFLYEHHAFRETYFADWKDVKLTCDSWMLVPELQELLGESSRIVAFQRLFEIDQIDREATWFLGWIYPGHDTVDENLPEKTSLQRQLKRYLLAGNKFGIAKGHLREPAQK